MATPRKRKPSSTRVKEEKLKKLHEEAPVFEEAAIQTPVKIEAQPNAGAVVYMEDGTEALLVPREHIKAIKRAGIDIEKAGAIAAANGYSVTTKHSLFMAMEAVTKKLSDEPDATMTVSLAKAIGYCANSMSKMIGEFRQINAMKKPDNRPKSKSFIPGSFVKGNQMVFNGPVQMNVTKNETSEDT